MHPKTILKNKWAIKKKFKSKQTLAFLMFMDRHILNLVKLSQIIILYFLLWVYTYTFAFLKIYFWMHICGRNHILKELKINSTNILKLF